MQKMLLGRSVVPCSVGLSLLIFIALAALGMKPHGKVVRISEIQSGAVTVIGTLNVPIGEVIRLTGRWLEPSNLAYEPKAVGGRLFEVTHVNGKQLRSTVKFSEENIQILIDENEIRDNRSLVRCSAFETFRYVGVPANAWNGGESPVQEVRTFGVYSELVIIRSVE